MQPKTLVYRIALAAGVLCSRFVRETINSAQPPITLPAIAFAFVGSIIGSVLVLGLQLLAKHSSSGRFERRLFTFIGLFIIAAGIVAAATDLWTSTFSVSAGFMLAVGGGLLLGTLLVRRLERESV